MITVKRSLQCRKDRIRETQGKQECTVAINLLHHSENTMRVTHDNATAI